MSRRRSTGSPHSEAVPRGTIYYRAICPACRHEFLIEAIEFRRYADKGGCFCPTCSASVPVKRFNAMIEVDRPVFKH